MSKLPTEFQFLDLSDYGRGIARWIAIKLKGTSMTAFDVTTTFIISGLLAIVCMIMGYFYLAAFFLILKSILDAADGELARIKNSPSYVGRYYDSIADIILNFLFLLTFWYITDDSIILMILAFISIQMQGTLYNYYYVILRNSVAGDTTSRVFEDNVPTALPGESQKTVNIYYHIYNSLYIIFDKLTYYLDRGAMNSRPFPKWFMTLVSAFGLGFHLLIMAIMLTFHLEEYVLSFFIAYSVLIFLFVGIRRLALK